MQKKRYSSDGRATDTEPTLNMVAQKGAKIEGKTIEMELNTGAAVSLISKELSDGHLYQLPLRQNNIILHFLEVF